MIAHFLSGCESSSIRNELIYLVLPFIHYKDSRKLLAAANSKSNLYSLFLSSEEGKISIAGLEMRLSYFKALTQTSLVVCAKEFQIEIGTNISISNPLDYSREMDLYIREYFKASYYLGKTLSKSEYLDTCIKLGLKNIWIA